MAYRAEEGRDGLALPLVRRIRQRLDASLREADVKAAVARELLSPSSRLRPGATVAVGVGSRGIADLDVIVRATVETLRERGARPFIVPAMGSHGGGTVEGQLEVLAGYGITPVALGASIDPDLETVVLGEVEGVPVHVGRAALRADAILPINRIKLHTSFRGPVESGLSKMLAIGFGKHAGAAALHRSGTRRFGDVIPRAAALVLEHAPVIGGLAVLENARGEVAALEFVPAADIPYREPLLLQRSRRLMAAIPFSRPHVLVVDYLGKDISGDGMDPNVTGRYAAAELADPEREPDVIAVLRLAERSHGNACGLGLADVTTQAVVDSLDAQSTWTNVVTSRELRLGRIPLWTATDREAVGLALSVAPCDPPTSARLVRVRNTLHLEDLWVSEALWRAEGEGREDLEVLSEAGPMEFTTEGRLRDLP